MCISIIDTEVVCKCYMAHMKVFVQPAHESNAEHRPYIRDVAVHGYNAACLMGCRSSCHYNAKFTMFVNNYIWYTVLKYRVLLLHACKGWDIYVQGSLASSRFHPHIFADWYKVSWGFLRMS